MEDKKLTIAVYDADFLPYYVCHNKEGEPIKTLEDCISLCDNFIDNINKSVKADYYCGFRTIGKCFRYQVDPQYKANRKYPHVEHLKEVGKHLTDSHGFNGQEGYEADDLVLSFKAQNSQYNVIIVSPDKDLLKCVDYAYNPRKNEFMINSESDIIQAFWESMITGDTVDNIKGIPRKGIDFARKLIKPGILLKHEQYLRVDVLNEYIKYYGEYEGIKEFTKNYLCLKIVDNVKLEEIKLNNVEKTILL